MNVKELENHEADKVRNEANQIREGLPPKHFIAHNHRLIKAIERDCQEN